MISILQTFNENDFPISITLKAIEIKKYDKLNTPPENIGDINRRKIFPHQTISNSSSLSSIIPRSVSKRKFEGIIKIEIRVGNCC